MTDEVQPDHELTMNLPPVRFDKPEDDDEGGALQPQAPQLIDAAPDLSGLPPTEANAAAADQDVEQGVEQDPVLRSPWSPAPTTSFSTPLAAETTGPVPVVPEYTAPALAPTVAVLPAPQTEQVTCPECGTSAMVNLTRREASDFCRNCDYPLFWTPSKILLDRSGLSDDSLRRLPGTVGRVTVASFPCPHCAEPNQLTAIDCVRCGRPLRPVHFEPAPVPMYLPPPPEPEPEPEPRGIPWWVWFGIALMLITITLVLLYAYNAWPFD